MRFTSAFLAALLLALILVGRGRAADVEQWGVWELSLDGPREGNPYLDVELSVTCRQEGDGVTVPGFYDGDGVYRVRFSPPAQGPWRYETRSNRPELNGKSGSFTAAPPSANNHGPVRVFHTCYLRYADGTPYHQFGTTCYAWTHQPRGLQEQTLQTLAASPFNKIRFCVFPKSYEYNKNEPELFAFQKGADGKFDFSRPDPAFWRQFEQRILDLQKLSIEADVILWHPYDRWGFARMTDEQDDRYLRYSIARLGALRNVWWSLANEFDFMSNLDRKHPGRKTMDDWDRFFAILQREDPHQRLRGIPQRRHPQRQFTGQTADRQMDLLRRDLRCDASGRECELVLQRTPGRSRKGGPDTRSQDDVQPRARGDGHWSAGDRQLQSHDAPLRLGPPVPRRDPRSATLRQPRERARSVGPDNPRKQASSALSQGQVFIRTERQLFCIGISDPRSWLKPAAEMGKSQHGGKGDIIGYGARRFILGLQGQTAPYSLVARINVNDRIESKTALEASRWYHAAMTCRPSGEHWHVRLFLDGQQVAEGTATKFPSGSTIPDSLILGAELFYLHDAYFRGLLSQVLVIGRTLNPEELRALARIRS